MFAAVVDTNVVVSGLTTAADDAAPVRILAGMLAGSIPFVVSETLLAEYRDVLNCPKLRKPHGLTRAQIETFLIALAQNAIVLTAAIGPAAPDPATSTCGIWSPVMRICALLPATSCCATAEHPHRYLPQRRSSNARRATSNRCAQRGHDSAPARPRRLSLRAMTDHRPRL